MKLLPFFSQRKPRKFDHKPIYFDPRKEALEERIQNIKMEMGKEIPTEEYKPQIKGAFVHQTKHLRRREGNAEKNDSSRNILMGVILALLIVIAYYVYFKG
ncbi:MAG: hypothetical protein PHV20_13635 [Bacteroidales bacterium]|nr:hypothetical protein [Bacteroidales bacterium]